MAADVMVRDFIAFSTTTTTTTTTTTSFICMAIDKYGDGEHKELKLKQY